MCDWRRAHERTFVGHVRYCYPRTAVYAFLAAFLILLCMVLEMSGVL